MALSETSTPIILLLDLNKISVPYPVLQPQSKTFLFSVSEDAET